MTRILSLITLALAVAMLIGCSPIYKTNYAYTPPKSDVGKMCTSQCTQNKMVCEQMCQMRKDNCKSQAKQDAFYKYQSYVNERKSNHLPVDKSVSDFDDSYFSCKDSCDCTSSFHTCYQACGGQITATQVCTAFCDSH